MLSELIIFSSFKSREPRDTSFTPIGGDRPLAWCREWEFVSSVAACSGRKMTARVRHAAPFRWHRVTACFDSPHHGNYGTAGWPAAAPAEFPLALRPEPPTHAPAGGPQNSRAPS